MCVFLEGCPCQLAKPRPLVLIGRFRFFFLFLYNLQVHTVNSSHVQRLPRSLLSTFTAPPQSGKLALHSPAAAPLFSGFNPSIARPFKWKCVSMWLIAWFKQRQGEGRKGLLSGTFIWKSPRKSFLTIVPSFYLISEMSLTTRTRQSAYLRGLCYSWGSYF